MIRTPWRIVAVAISAVAAAAIAAGADGVERIELGGELVALAAPEPDGPIYLLVRPAAGGDASRRQMTISPGAIEVAPAPQAATGPDAPRRLLRIAPGATTAETVADGIGGWTKALAAVELSGGVELVAGGLGRLDALGPLAAPGGTRSLIAHPGFDLRSLRPSRLRVGVERSIAATEVGALRLWRPDAAGGLELAADVGLPFAVERRGPGLRLSGPPVAELAPDAAGRRRFAVGPEAMGGARLRVLLVAETADGWATTECWVRLPAPETVEESWIGDGDEGPLLVVRSQSALEINAFENQRWRLFRLVPDRTRTGRAAAMAVEVDSKRWHDDAALVADADGDGKTDLLVARPEGMTGGDLVVERYVGGGGGRFDPRSRRTDLDSGPSDFVWLADIDGRGRPGLVARSGRELAVWRVASDGRRALEREPLLRAELGREGEKATFAILGALPRPGRPPEILVVEEAESGASRLVRLSVPSR